jgi:fibronectin-binding autotransporter adhesin
MKNSNLKYWKSAVLAALAASFGPLSVRTASAADDAWVGNSSINWNTAANWNPASVPAAGDSLFFGTAGSAGAALTNDMAGGSFAGITFNSGADAFTFTGNGIALAGGITNNSANAQTINFAITDNASITFNDGGGETTISGAVSGSGALTNAGNGTVILNNNNPFTGGVTINNGTLQVGGSGGNSALGKGNTTVNVGGNLIGTGGDAFGYPTHNNPATIFINGGTISDLPGAYRITLPNLIFAGGTLTSDPGNTGNAGTQYSLNGDNTTCAITTVASSSTAVINAAALLVQRETVFNVAAGNVSGGAAPGVDLLVSGVLAYTSGHHGITKTGAGTLELTGANTYASPGNTTINAGTLALSGSGSVASTLIAVTNGARFDVSGLSSTFTLPSGKTLGGNGMVTGSVVTASSSTIDAGLYGGSTLSFSNDLTLGGSTIKFVLSGAPGGANSKIAVAGNLNYSGANTISLSGFASLQNGAYPLFTYGSETTGGTWTITGLTSGLQTANLVDTGAGEIDLVVAPVSNVTNLTWAGDGVANNWDTITTNWLNGANPDVYNDGDEVTFDDSGSTNPPVNLTGTLQPAVVLVTNNTRDYTFNGPGAISGSAGLVKAGAGTLTLAEYGGDAFTGGIIVSGGSLVVSNYSAGMAGGIQVSNGTAVLDQAGPFSGNTLIYNGATVQVGVNDTFGALPSGTVTMDGNLVFNRTDTFTVGNVISGASTGNLIISNFNNVTLTAANTYAGNIQVNSGTLTDSKIGASDGSSSGLGAAVAGRMITVGTGATLNSTVQNWFGGGGVADANLPSITINGGTVNSARYTTLGSVTLNDGAALTQSASDSGTYQGYQFRGGVTVGGSSASTISSGNGKDDDLGSNTVFNVADVTGDANPDLFVTTGLQNQSGDFGGAAGGLTKTGAGTMQLSGANTYTGNTTINAGTLALNSSGSISNSLDIAVAGGATFDVSGLSPAFALASFQTLSNSSSTAVLNGNADASGGTISLTYASGTPSLTIINGALTLSSGTMFKVNNTGAALAAGSYKLISAGTSGSVAGTAPSAVAVGGGGIVSGTRALAQISGGELYLVVRAQPMPFITSAGLSGTTLTITATNGSADGQFVLLQSTNVALPLANWAPVLTNTFDGSGNLDLSTNIANPDAPQEFYILSQ